MTNSANDNQSLTGPQRAGQRRRQQSRQRLLNAAAAEFSERGYAAATVERIAERAEVSLQTLYHAWGSKRALLRGYLESCVGGTDEPLTPGQPPSIVLAGVPPTARHDPQALLRHLVHQYRLVAQRSATAWACYRDAAGADPDIAADWQHLHEVRRQSFTALIGLFPAGSFRSGLSRTTVINTAWAVASPETYELLVTRSGYSTARLESWVLDTLATTLLAQPPARPVPADRRRKVGQSLASP